MVDNIIMTVSQIQAPLAKNSRVRGGKKYAKMSVIINASEISRAKVQMFQGLMIFIPFTNYLYLV